VPNEAHASKYSEFLDGTQLASARACGSCHDIINDKGAHIERTFEEWNGTVFSSPVLGQTCAQCHLPEGKSKETIADGPKAPGVFLRFAHDHKMPGVDTALTDFPQIDAQKEAVTDFLDKELQTAICVASFGAEAKIAILADNVAAGHRWPSGSAQDRQLWFEVTAYAGGTQIYQSGKVPEGVDPKDVADDDLWLIRDCMFDEQGKETHNFWEAKTYDFNTLPGQVTLDQSLPAFYLSHVARIFPSSASARTIPTFPDRVTLKVWLQAFPYSVFDEHESELKTLGHDDAQIKAMRAKLAPVQVSAQSKPAVVGRDLEWTAAAAADTDNGGQSFPNKLIPGIPNGLFVQCVTGTAMKANVQNVTAPVHKTCKP
jgi:hypothetical protein